MENMTTREEGDELYIEGYFAVFNGVYELWARRHGEHWRRGIRRQCGG